MKKKKWQNKKAIADFANFVMADIFEEACQLFRQNWRYCVEVYLILLLIAGGGSGIILSLWKIRAPTWSFLLTTIIIMLVISILIIGKNKNFGGLVRGMSSERYPLWAKEYFLSGLRWLLIKLFLFIPILLGISLAIFYLIISPSNLWLWLCILSCSWLEGWLLLRFNLSSAIVSLKNDFTLKKSWEMSWARTKEKAQKLIPWLVFNSLIFAPVIIFLPILGWFLTSVILNFEWLIINQRLYENRL